MAWMSANEYLEGLNTMIERYSRPEMRAIWTEENKFKAWLEVELCACEAWAELGVIPHEDVAALRENAKFDIDRIYEIELETRHDVIAFTRAVSETLGPERKWVHYGLTSTDVVDTATGLFAAAGERNPARKISRTSSRFCASKRFATKIRR